MSQVPSDVLIHGSVTGLTANAWESTVGFEQVSLGSSECTLMSTRYVFMWPEWKSSGHQKLMPLSERQQDALE